MSDRIRLALLIFVVMTSITARVGGALGAPARADRATVVSAKQAKVVRYARRLLCVRYVYGGTTPRTGFDCSGFTRYVYASIGMQLPHYTGSQFALGRRVARRSLRPGDLLFFNGLGHEGMYIGGGRFIHAPSSGKRVSIAALSGWYEDRYVGARRLLR